MDFGASWSLLLLLLLLAMLAFTSRSLRSWTLFRSKTAKASYEHCKKRSKKVENQKCLSKYLFTYFGHFYVLFVWSHLRSWKGISSRPRRCSRQCQSDWRVRSSWAAKWSKSRRRSALHVWPSRAWTCGARPWPSCACAQRAAFCATTKRAECLVVDRRAAAAAVRARRVARRTWAHCWPWSDRRANRPTTCRLPGTRAH